MENYDISYLPIAEDDLNEILRKGDKTHDKTGQ